jgi:phosphoglycerate kinase
MKSLNDYKLEDKTILLRVDINSEIKNKKVLMSKRIKNSAKTINFLKSKNARVVVIAHQGRPGDKDFTSLRKHCKLLNQFTKIRFVDDIIGKKAVDEIKKLKNGEALLLENIRTLKEEFNPGKNKFVKKLSALCDIYVNDAFSICHRNHSSIVSFPKYLKSFVGPSLYRELKILENLNFKNVLYILSGAKIEENIELIKNKNKVLSGGVFSLLCLIAKGKKLGISELELRENIINFDKIIRIIKKNLYKIETPIDLAINKSGKRLEIDLEKFPVDYKILDIGENTIKKYSKIISKSKFVYMKGPIGVCEYKNFCKGTQKLLRYIAKCKNFSLIGGGHLNTVVESMEIPEKNFGYLSLSGGALSIYLAGGKLPGLEALK